jgi:hypothetical protein
VRVTRERFVCTRLLISSPRVSTTHSGGLGDAVAIRSTGAAKHVPRFREFPDHLLPRRGLPAHNRGYSATREQAMADFKAQWVASINCGCTNDIPLSPEDRTA